MIDTVATSSCYRGQSVKIHNLPWLLTFTKIMLDLWLEHFLSVTLTAIHFLYDLATWIFAFRKLMRKMPYTFISKRWLWHLFSRLDLRLLDFYKHRLIFDLPYFFVWVAFVFTASTECIGVPHPWHITSRETITVLHYNILSFIVQIYPLDLSLGSWWSLSPLFSRSKPGLRR